MKVCLVCPNPRNYPILKFEWVFEAFRNVGHDVRYAHTLGAVADADKECDLLLFFHKTAGLSDASLIQMAARRRATWVQWWFDLIALEAGKSLAEQFLFQQFRRLLAAFDAVLVKEADLLGEYKQHGVNAIWFDQACPSNMPACEYAERPEWDVLVLGDAGRRNRREDAKALADAGLRVLWAGRPSNVCVPLGIEWHPWVHPLELPKLISRCGVVLGVDYRTDVRGYTSDRTWLAIGAGAVYVMRGHNSADSTVNGYFSMDSATIGDIRQMELAVRRNVGECARERVMKFHTYERRAVELESMFERGELRRNACTTEGR